MKKIIIIIAIIVLGIWIFSRSNNNAHNSPEQMMETNIQTSVSLEESNNRKADVTVVYDGNSFSPEVVEISNGETVLFINNSNNAMWVASDPHPMHTNLPTFDQFGVADAGGSYSYTFTGNGEWNYHNHMSPFMFGTVVVS